MPGSKKTNSLVRATKYRKRLPFEPFLSTCAMRQCRARTCRLGCISSNAQSAEVLREEENIIIPNLPTNVYSDSQNNGYNISGKLPLVVLSFSLRESPYHVPLAVNYVFNIMTVSYVLFQYQEGTRRFTFALWIERLF